MTTMRPSQRPCRDASFWKKMHVHYPHRHHYPRSVTTNASILLPISATWWWWRWWAHHHHRNHFPGYCTNRWPPGPIARSAAPLPLVRRKVYFFLCTVWYEGGRPLLATNEDEQKHETGSGHLVPPVFDSFLLHDCRSRSTLVDLLLVDLERNSYYLLVSWPNWAKKKSCEVEACLQVRISSINWLRAFRTTFFSLLR